MKLRECFERYRQYLCEILECSGCAEIHKEICRCMERDETTLESLRLLRCRFNAPQHVGCHEHLQAFVKATLNEYEYALSLEMIAKAEQGEL